MNDMVEMDRLARANPVPAGSLASPPPRLPAAERRRRLPRIGGALLAALGALALIALLGALILAVPSDDAAAPAVFDGTLRLSLLDRPQTAEDRIDMSGFGAIDPASTRLALHRGDESWFAARMRDDPTSICLVQLRPHPNAGCAGVSPLLRSGMLLVRWLPHGLRGGIGADLATLRSEVVGLVPDGIESVTVGDQTVTVTDNAFAIEFTGKVPEVAVLAGPATVAIPPAPGTVVVVPSTSTTPVVPVVFRPGGAAPELEPGLQRPPLPPPPTPPPDPGPSAPSAPRASPTPPAPIPRPIPAPPPAPGTP